MNKRLLHTTLLTLLMFLLCLVAASAFNSSTASAQEPTYGPNVPAIPTCYPDCRPDPTEPPDPTDTRTPRPPTNTFTPISPPTNTFTPPPTNTRTPTTPPTSTPRLTNTSTNTPIPTNTPTLTRTNTPTNTPIPTHSSTPTMTPLVSSTPTLTPLFSYTPTPTPTDTPTAAGTDTPTFTVTPTSTPCVANYVYSVATAAIVPGTTDIGNHDDDAVTAITLPFPISFYGDSYSNAYLSSNGNIQFVNQNSNFSNVDCIVPDASFGPALLPHWDDLTTESTTACNGGPCGIFTSVSGTAPNRVFNIEWRAENHIYTGAYVNFEARLYEGRDAFDFIYGHVDYNGASATVSAQMGDAGHFTRFECNTSALHQGMLIHWTLLPCGVTPTPTPAPCEITFTDTRPTDYFYTAVRYLYCHGSVSGYADNTFRPFNNTTRAQLSKIIVLARGWNLECPSTAHFTDVAVGSPFFCFVETAFSHGIISGYSDNTFRPGNNVTRAQLSKVVALAMSWTQVCPITAHFTDVAVDSTFFCFVETAFSHGVISGYSDNTFRPGNNATRGQICKIVYSAITGQ